MMCAVDRGTWPGLLIAVLCLLLSAGYAEAREAVVTTLDGLTLEGELIGQDETTVTLMISGIKTPIPRKTIDSIQLKEAPAEQYRKMRAELEDDDLDGRYRLAYTMYEKKWYELSLQELSALERDFPDSEKVRALKSVVQGSMERERQRQTETSRPATTPRTPQTPVNVVTEMPGHDQRLTEEQINLIKVYEVDLDAQPNVIVTDETIQKLFENYASSDRLKMDQREFRRLPGHEKLGVLFDLQARDLYKDVIVRQDPPAIRAFRSELHSRYVLNYCAAKGCHGDGSPGGLFLFRIQPNSDATVYTNFYILNQKHTDRGAMIDRDEPRRSLLLQFGLKRDAASVPHPDVKGWRPRFNDEQDPLFQRYAEVIDQLWKPAPKYGINYSPPIWKKPADETNGDQAAP